jgi:hypothetical protein
MRNQDMMLFFDIEDHPELHFKDVMERAMHAKPVGPLKDYLTNNESTPKVKDFFGLGSDERTYHFNGRLHAIPPQQGIPGFQRISMIKYLPDEKGSYSLGHISVWGYEGCVLPGNQIMLGRWWRLSESDLDGPSYCGPFIFWQVEATPEEKLADAEVALKFLDEIGGEPTVW